MNEGKVKPSISIIKPSIFEEHKRAVDEEKTSLGLQEWVYEKILSNNKYEIDFHSSSKDCAVIFFKQAKQVEWHNFIADFLDQDTIVKRELFMTGRPSFILIKELDRMIFLLTTGMASVLIDDIKDKTFGLDIVMKLIEDNTDVIKSLSDKKVYGTRAATKIFNRFTTNFKVEENYESIYGEITLTADHIVQANLGLEVKLNDNGIPSSQTLTISFGSNISINKLIGRNELEKVLVALGRLYRKPNKFTMGFLVPIEKYNFKKSEILFEFSNAINKDSCLLDFHFNYDLDNQLEKYVLKNTNGGETLKLENLKELRFHLRNKVDNNVNALTILNGYYIECNEPNEGLASKYKIKDLIEGTIEYANRQMYILDGNWYLFDVKYTDALNKDYRDRLEESRNLCDEQYKTINFDPKKCKNEEELKNIIRNHSTILDSDEVYYKNVELADGIYLSNDTIYMMHNKTSATGSGTRDITGQIATAAKLISAFRYNYSLNRSDVDKYLCALENKNLSKKNELNLLKTALQDSRYKVVYIGNFTDDLRVDTLSYYIKYLLVSTYRGLGMLNMEFYYY